MFRNIATKDFGATEEAKYYDIVEEGPAYEAVGEGRSKTGGSEIPLSIAGEFHLKECPAYGPTPTGHATTSVGDSQEYEVIRDPGRKAEVQLNLVSTIWIKNTDRNQAINYVVGWKQVCRC